MLNLVDMDIYKRSRKNPNPSADVIVPPIFNREEARDICRELLVRKAEEEPEFKLVLAEAMNYMVPERKISSMQRRYDCSVPGIMILDDKTKIEYEIQDCDCCTNKTYVFRHFDRFGNQTKNVEYYSDIGCDICVGLSV